MEVETMSVGPVPAPRSFEGPDHLGRWAVRLAGATGGVLVVAYGILGVALATGGQDAISDNWVGTLGAVALLGGLATSGAAFVMALVTRWRHHDVPLLWLPTALFPALVLTTAAVELFWME
jgi:hypothetical protein